MKNFKMGVIVSSCILISGVIFFIGKKKRPQKADYKLREDKCVTLENYKIKIPDGFKKFHENERCIQFVKNDEILITASIIDYKITNENLVNVLYTVIDTEKKHYENYEEKEFKAISYKPITNCFFVGSSGIGCEKGLIHEIYMWNYVNINGNNVLYINIIKKYNAKNAYDKEISDMVVSVTYDGGKE